MPRATHGTHVADLAAGAGVCRRAAGRRRRGGAPAAARPGGHVGQRAEDAGPGCAALHHRARRPQAGVVVNPSCGTMAGAHDGGSILECAIDELISLLDGRLNVVLPAGNSYEARGTPCSPWTVAAGRRRCGGRCCPTTQPQLLSRSGCPGLCRVPPQRQGGRPFGRTSGWRASARSFRRRAHRRREPTSASSSRPGGRFAGTARWSWWRWPRRPAGCPGRRGRAPAGGRSHCVMTPPPTTRSSCTPDRARRLAAWPATAGRQSFFIDAGGESGRATVRAAGSFNAIANGRQTIVVGGYVASTGAVARYSGGGPTRGERIGPVAGAQRGQPDTAGPDRGGHVGGGQRAHERHQRGGTTGGAADRKPPGTTRRGRAAAAHAAGVSGRPGPLARGRTARPARLGRGLLPRAAPHYHRDGNGRNSTSRPSRAST